MKREIKKKTIIVSLLLLVLTGVGYLAYLDQKAKNTAGDVVAAQQHEPTPEDLSSAVEAQPSEEAEITPSVEGSSTEGSSNPSTSGSSGQSVPRNNQPQPKPNGGNASGGQSTPAPQKPSTPQPSQPQQQAPSRPQWKEVIVGYCDVTIGDDFNQSYKNAEACFQKVLPEKPIWCGVAYAPTSGYDCYWNGITYGIDVHKNYVYYLIRA